MSELLSSPRSSCRFRHDNTGPLPAYRQYDSHGQRSRCSRFDHQHLLLSVKPDPVRQRAVIRERHIHACAAARRGLLNRQTIY